MQSIHRNHNRKERRNQPEASTFLRRKDLLLTGALLAAAFLLFLMQSCFSAEGGFVEVSVDGTVLEVFSLTDYQSIPISGYKGGSNLLVISENGASVIEADCPDGLCRKQGFISRSGESIICLPHRVTILIKSGKQSELDTMSR